MSTDCYAVVFEDGATAIIPVVLEVLITDPARTRWQFVDANGCAMERPLSQVWHCPSPASAAQILRELGKGYHAEKDIYDGYRAAGSALRPGCDAVLLCRNPAPKEKP